MRPAKNVQFAFGRNLDRVWAPKGGEPVIATLNRGVYNGNQFFVSEYEVVRNMDRCIICRVCERQCANEVHSYDQEKK